MQRPETKKYAADGMRLWFCNEALETHYWPLVAVFALSQVAFYFAFKWIIGSLDPSKAKRQEAKNKSSRVLGKLGVSLSPLFHGPSYIYRILSTKVKDLKLTEYEQIIAAEVVHADEINVTFKRT